MYQKYWQLNSQPFPYRMSATECYPAASQQAALLRLQYCVENSAGCALIVGESGLGKTTLLRQLEHAGAQLKPFCYLAFPGLSSVEQLRLLASQLVEAPHSAGGAADSLLLDIAHNMQRYASQGKHPVISFDDAQRLDASIMSDVVLPLLNLRDIDDTVDFTVVLSGQPVLMSQLSRHPQLRERIAVTARLGGMTMTECEDYVSTRLRAAGASADIFSSAALKRLHECSQGNPRRLNRLCDMAMLVGCAEQVGTIEQQHIESVSTELFRAA